MLVRDPAQDEVSQIGVALQPSVTMRPTTERVTQAFRDEARFGVGTLNADVLAYETEKPGQRISYDEWKKSPYFDESITYYPSMTIDGAIAHKEMVDFSKKNAEIISRATLGQTALGYGHAFAAGMAEPKNLLSGVAASAVLSPIGGLGVTGIKSSKRLLQLNRNINRYGQLAARGFGEGLVAAAITEPSNRSSAAILQQEYTLADTLWNVGLSSVLGAGISTAPAFIRDKVRRNRFNAADIVAEEIDVATAQLAEGQRVDVSIVEQVRARPEVAAEQFVRYTETPEFKARLEGVSSEVIDDGRPVMAYHGTGRVFDHFGGDINDAADDIIYATSSSDVANTYTSRGSSPNVRPLYPLFKNPKVIDADGRNWAQIAKTNGKDVSVPYAARLAKSEGYDGLIVRNVVDVGGKYQPGVLAKPSTVYASLDPNNMVSAFGADDLPAIESRMQREHLEKIEAARRPEASTAIDVDGAKAMQRRVDELPETINYEEQFNNDMDKIRSMVDQGIIPESVFDEYMTAIDSMNEADITESLKTLENCLLRG